MRKAAAVISVFFITLVFGCASAGITPVAETTSGDESAARSREFHAFLDDVDAAQLELQNGRAAAFKSLWSHRNDITLSGGFGGTVEKGWEQIGSRLDWVADQFSNGTHENTRIVSGFSGELGYVVQLEHLQFTVPGQSDRSERSYRVTMLFRREGDAWRIIHRQADSQMTKSAPH